MPTPATLQSGGGVLARHQAALDSNRFLIQRCRDCGRAVYFPREICLHCGSGRLEWEEPLGTGTVYATTTVRRKTADGGDFNVSVIDLDEGVRLMSRVERLPVDEVRIGLRVSARVVQRNGHGLVVFEPAAAAEAPNG